MRNLLPLISFFGLLAAAYSAIFFERQVEIPGYESQCYDKDDNIFYKKGEEMKWKLEVCGKKLCRGSSGKGTVFAEIFTCGKIEVPPECHVEINLALQYPKCCGTIVCPEDIDNETQII